MNQQKLETSARLAIEIAGHHLAAGTIEQQRNLARAIVNAIGICQQEIGKEFAALGNEAVLDTVRLNFLEKWAKQSQTGISICWDPEAEYRFMTYHKIDDGQPDARAAIDAAIRLRKSADKR
jgi:hypothetical protein